MVESLQVIASHLDCKPGVAPEALGELERKLGTPLPNDYKDLLSLADGATGFYGAGYWIIYASSDVPQNTAGYGAPEFAPGLVIIASNGGSGLYGIDTRSADPGAMAYVEVDAITMSWDEIWFRADTLVELFEHYR